MPKPFLMGFFSPLIALVFIMIAILLAPGFTWLGNALSDLGHYTSETIGPNPFIRAIFFNSGLIITGLVMFVFVFGFMKHTTDVPTKVGMLPFLISILFLIAIGIFSENFGQLHFIVSVGFFASFPFSMWIIGFAWLRLSHLRAFSVISIILPFVSVWLWYITYNLAVPWTGVAIPEIITALTAIGWIWFINFLHYRGRLNSLLKQYQHNM